MSRPRTPDPRAGKAARLGRRLLLHGAGPAPCEPLEARLMPSADVLTYHNDNARTGVSPNETILTPANVNVATFGKVGQVQVDGQVYAQPLYKSNVSIPGQGVHNVVYVATEHDSVYAFDAQTLSLLWHRSFINPALGVTTVPTSDIAANPLTPELGITGTPVIDPSSSTLYVVALTREALGGAGTYVQRLHALDLGTGREKFRGPVTIRAAVPGTGSGSDGGLVSFQAVWELQRPGLLLSKGKVYIAWASWGDIGPYHGWVMAYDARTLRQVAALNLTPDGQAGGIWMAGAAPSADAFGNVYVASGNGTFDADRGGRNYGDTLLKLSPTLKVLDYFTPFNQKMMEDGDLDFGSGGIVLLPPQPGSGRNLMVTSAKEGRLYLVDRDNLGKYSPGGDRIVQEIPNALKSAFDTPAYFNGTVYYVGTGPGGRNNPLNHLRAFRITTGVFGGGQQGNDGFAYPGSTPSISSNGPSNGIVWTLDSSEGSGTAILRAYDAGNVARELYDSTQAGLRDLPGQGVKFSVPTVADGRVYVGNTGALTVYGLFNPPPQTSSLPPVRGRFPRRFAHRGH